MVCDGERLSRAGVLWNGCKDAQVFLFVRGGCTHNCHSISFLGRNICKLRCEAKTPRHSSRGGDDEFMNRTNGWTLPQFQKSSSSYKGVV